MSSELIEIECDENDTYISLEMNAHSHAWIVVCSEDGVERYHLPPDIHGLNRAKEIAIGLQNWIDHVDDIASIEDSSYE